MSGSSPGTRIRRNVRTLGAAGDDLDWYGKAVAALRALPLTDPTGWRYQAAIHGYPGNAKDPFATVGEAIPSKAEQHRFWNRCQHQSWFFLPWHRGYLACFEEIVAATVVRLGGPSQWALPYWNYSEAGKPGARSLPAAFLPQHLADGSDNPLWSAGRKLAVPADQIPVSDVDLGCLIKSPFSALAIGGPPGFGGPKTGFSHVGGVNGELEAAPHNLVHDDTGGLMLDPDTAALDPIFWLHHANIDRLWEVWRKRDLTFVNPTDAAWLSGTSFDLHDSFGATVTFTSDQMVDTLKVRHGYRYDDTSDPYARPGLISFLTVGAPVPAKAPRLVGASRTSIPLSGITMTQVAFEAMPAPGATLALREVEMPNAFLNIENVTGKGLHGVYDIYVAAPGAPANRLLAGHLSTFGVEKASDPAGPHGGSGITTVLDITPLVRRLRQEKWDGRRLDVTFVPRDADALSGKTIGLNVGRVSVYHG